MFNMSFRMFRLYCSLLYMANQIWIIYLSKRQLDVLLSKRQIPSVIRSFMDDGIFNNAAEYGIKKRRFELVYTTIETIIEAVAIYFNGLAILWSLSERISGFYNSEILTTSIFLIVILGASCIFSLPFKLYFNFVIERDFGFNKQNIPEFLKDVIKKYALLAGLLTPTIAGLITIIRWKGDTFFLLAAVFVAFVSLGLVFIYPDFIAPMFDEFVPMVDCSLKQRITALAESVKFPSFKIYVVKGSKKSGHSNAYFTGLFKTRRIVLYDTLVGHLLPSSPETSPIENTSLQLNEEEILAILAHELGHWNHGHVYKLLTSGLIQLFSNFYIYSLLYKWKFMYNAFGFQSPHNMPLLIGMIIVFSILLVPIDQVQSLFGLMLSRHFERQADEYGVAVRNATDMKNALIKLYADNLDFPYYDWLYSECTLNHPPLLERLDHIERLKHD